MQGTGQDAADAAQSNLSGAGEELKAAAKDARAAFSEAGDRAHVDGHRNKEGAKAEVCNTAQMQAKFILQPCLSALTSC